MGIVIPAWYFAPQKNALALTGWRTAAALSGLLADGPVTGLDDPGRATMLLQIAGEFADAETKQRLWSAAEPFIEPQWDRDAGEFSLGFRLNEHHPRGQLNARSMAGWVCTPGAWSRIFNEPNLDKFDQPSVEGVDFPRVALSEARWDGEALHLAAHPQNAAVAGTRARVRVSNIGSRRNWILVRANGEQVALSASGGTLQVELVADNQPATLRSV